MTVKSLDDLIPVLDAFMMAHEEIMDNGVRVHSTQKVLTDDEQKEFAAVKQSLLESFMSEEDAETDEGKLRILRGFDQMALFTLRIAPPAMLAALIPQDEEFAAGFDMFDAPNMAKLCRLNSPQTT